MCGTRLHTKLLAEIVGGRVINQEKEFGLNNHRHLASKLFNKNGPLAAEASGRNLGLCRTVADHTNQFGGPINRTVAHEDYVTSY